MKNQIKVKIFNQAITKQLCLLLVLGNFLLCFYACESPDDDNKKGGGGTSFLPLITISLDINGSVSNGVIDNDKKSVTFRVPFTSTTIPTKGRLETLQLSDKSASSISIGSFINFINQKAALNIQINGLTDSYELNIVNTENDIKEFSFLKSINPQLSFDLIGTIDGNKNITFSTPVANTIEINQLIPTFKASIYSTVKKSSQVQISSQTPGDFSIINTYVVTAQDGASISRYNIQPIPQNVVIPDDNFRAFLKSTYPNAFDGDLLTPSANIINQVTSLDVSSKNIVTLSGIEYFTKLTSLNCSSNSLTSLNLKKLINLTSLQCSFNAIRSIDLSGNANLISLNLSNNNLTNIDLSKLTKLETLNVSINRLTSLQTISNPELKTLMFANNSVTSINLDINTKLTSLDCSSNLLSNLSLTVHTELRNLSCAFNTLTSLDISGSDAFNSLTIISGGTNDNDNLTSVIIKKSISSNSGITKIRNERPNVTITEND